MAHSVGRVVRWDVRAGVGAVVVEGLHAEVQIDEDAVQAAGGRDLQPGELVEITYEQTELRGGYRATQVCPTDEEP